MKNRWLVLLISMFVAMLGLATVATVNAFAGGTSVEGNCLGGGMAGNPLTPVVPAVQDNLNDTATITWTDTCTNVDYYNIEISSDNGAHWSLLVSGLTFDRILAPPGQNGTYTTDALCNGTYIFRVIAVHKPGRALPKTSISSNSGTFTVTDNDCGGGTTGGDCTQLSGALTLGYYSNKNGQATITSADLAYLNGLSLRDAQGGIVTFTTNAQFGKWLLNATAKNMSYMLSAQLATLELTIRHGLVNPADVLCEVEPAGTTIGDIVTLAEQFIVDHGKVLGGDPNRVDGDALQTIINEINNNQVSVIIPTP